MNHTHSTPSKKLPELRIGSDLIVPLCVYRAVLDCLGHTQETDPPAKPAVQMAVGGEHWQIKRDGLIYVEHRPHGFDAMRLVTDISALERELASLTMKISEAEQRLRQWSEEVDAIQKGERSGIRPGDLAIAQARQAQAADDLRARQATYIVQKIRLEDLRARYAEANAVVHTYILDPEDLWEKDYSLEVGK